MERPSQILTRRWSIRWSSAAADTVRTFVAGLSQPESLRAERATVDEDDQADTDQRDRQPMCPHRDNTQVSTGPVARNRAAAGQAPTPARNTTLYGCKVAVSSEESVGGPGCPLVPGDGPVVDVAVGRR